MENRKLIKKNLKIVLSYIGIFIIMLILFCTSMIVSYSLPNQRIQNHIIESKDVILTSNGNNLFGENIKGWQLDEFTDLLILNTSMNKGREKNESIIARAFANSNYSDETGNQIIALEKTLDNPDLNNNREYTRYWHGIQAILRPLLLVFNVEEIKLLFMILLFILLAISIICIAKNLSVVHAIAFLFSMLAVGIYIVPISLQYIGIFLITIISVIFVNILYYYKKEKLYGYLFFIIGGLASFFDLLTVPALTLGIPLLITILLMSKSENRTKKILLKVIQYSVLWCIAYATIFFAKWVIASLVLHTNAITIAINNLLFRVNGNDTYPATRCGAISANFQYLINTVIIAVWGIIIITWIIALIKNRKKVKDMKLVIPVIFVGLYPYIWYAAFAGHSTIHAFFTYRLQAISILSILYVMIECIDINKIRKVLINEKDDRKDER